MDKPMALVKRVALFTGNYNHIADGVSRTLNRLVGYLERNGVDVLVFGPSVIEPAVSHAGELVVVPSMPAPGRPEYRISTVMTAEVRRRLADFDPTIIHVATPDLLGLQARRVALRKGIPLVATYHTHFSSYLSYYRMSVMESSMWSYLKWFYKPFRHIYVPSNSMADVLRAHQIENGVEIWPRGVETNIFKPEHRNLNWRRRHGIADEDVVVSFISRLVWEKGPGVFADVVEALQAKHRRVKSMIVGDGPARAELQGRLRNTLFLGHLESSELATAYASTDIFLFPSETETFGNVTLEAMASGVPAVCADATGSRSLVVPDETGYLVKPKDTARFIEVTEKLLLDDNLRKKMGENSLKRAAAYDWEAVLGKMVTFYDRLLEEAGLV